MKLTPLYITVGSLAALAVVVHFATKPQTPDLPNTHRVGQKVVAPELLRNVQTIELSSADGQSFVISRAADNIWRLTNEGNLPVDNTKLAQLSATLADNDVIRYVTSNEERIERLNFGRRTLTLSAENHEPVTITLGKNSTRGGIYARFNDETEAYLLQKEINFETRMDNWRDSRILEYTSREVKEVTVKTPHSEQPWTFTVIPEKSSTFTTDLELENHTFDSSKVRSLINTISSLRYRNYQERTDDIDFSDAITITLTNTDNKQLTLQVLEYQPVTESTVTLPEPKIIVRYSGEWLPEGWEETTQRLDFIVGNQFWREVPKELKHFFREKPKDENTSATEPNQPPEEAPTANDAE